MSKNNYSKTIRENAENNFLNGYNCSQSIVLAFSDYISVDENELLKISCSFGGGMGRLREVCGAFSGALIILGLLYGYSSPEKGEIKAEQYKKVQIIAQEFENKYGSLVCRDLLKMNERHSSYIPSERNSEFYKSRPCKEIIGDVAEILYNFVEKHNQIS